MTRVTLDAWQRNVVAIATGMKLRGKMTYECTVAPFSARREPMARYTFTVEADNPHMAAQEAAAHCAATIDGQPSFIAPQRDGTFIASIGRQQPADDGVCTHGFSVRITVALCE